MAEVAQQTTPSTQKPPTFDARAYAANSPTSGMSRFTLKRRAPGPQDVQIEILYCGVCHSDLHQVRNEWRRHATVTLRSRPRNRRPRVRSAAP